MSVAEKLKAEGRREGHTAGREEGLERGLEKGRIIGKIQTLEEFLGQAASPHGELEAMGPEALEERCEQLHSDYEARFKGR